MQNHICISFGIADTFFVMYTPDSTYHIYSTDVLTLTSMAEKSEIQLRMIPNTLISTYSSINESVSCEVPLVNNEHSPATGKGMCWMAAMAALFNGRFGSSLTAMNIYDQLKNSYGYEPEDHTIWYQRFFGMYSVTCNIFQTMLFYETIKSCISDGKPIICRISDSDNWNAHAVTIKAVRRSSSVPSGYNCSYVYYYTVMDPGIDSSAHYSVMIIDPTDDSVSYTSEGYTFVNWYGTVY